MPEKKSEEKSKPEILTPSQFSIDLDAGKYDKWAWDTLVHHYCALVYKYVPAKSLGQTKVPLTKDILAHFIIIHAIACILTTERTEKGVGGYKPGFGESLSSGDDYMMALDSERFPDYPMTEAEKLLGEDIKQGYTTEEKLREDIEKIVPNDTNLIMIWDVSLQNTAKSRGEFKKLLEAALKSVDLNRMPKAIADINKSHISDLIHPYRMGKPCPNCGWDIPCLSGITTIASSGDEMDYRYFRCENDGRYFVSQLHDKAMSDDTGESFYEINPEDAKVVLDTIKKCPEPDNKHCKCETHKNWK